MLDDVERHGQAQDGDDPARFVHVVRLGWCAMTARGWLVGVTIAAAFAVGGLADGPAVVPAPPAPAPARTVAAEHTLASLLPFYRVQAPTWCAEDMACWVGSAADGRTDAEILASLQPLGEPVTDETGSVHAGCMVVVGETSMLVCPDGWVSVS